MEIRGTGVILRSIKEEDLPTLLSFFMEKSVSEFLAFENKREISDYLFFAMHNREEYEFVIFSEIEKEVVGMCGFTSFDEINNSAELSFLISERKRKKGYAMNALLALIDYGFSMLQFQRIEAYTFEKNINARKLLSKLDFLEEGIKRDACKKNNKFFNLVQYSLLRNEYLLNLHKV